MDYKITKTCSVFNWLRNKIKDMTSSQLKIFLQLFSLPVEIAIPCCTIIIIAKFICVPFYILGAPMALILVITYTTYILGPSALLGCFIFLVMFLIQVSKKVNVLF